MQNLSPNAKRDLSFIGLAVFVSIGIWSPGWQAPIWQTILLYALALVCLFPAIKNAKETGLDPIGNAIVPVISGVLMMLSAISYFLWEMFFRY
ncbi:MAG: hypothetical protein H6818_14170 [Phycisphaerales bacterium]|nr:hypothetical protein [Phycisphaerales bacterium]MCB9862050.1 hypothetical protein [Phycisphaerales bacterium]